MTAAGSLRHVQSGKCIMAKGGYTNPPNNNKLVLSSTCGQAKQKFSWLPSECTKPLSVSIFIIYSTVNIANMVRYTGNLAYVVAKVQVIKRFIFVNVM